MESVVLPKWCGMYTKEIFNVITYLYISFKKSEIII